MLNIVICDDDIAIIQYLRKLVLDHFSHRNIQLYTFSSVHTLSNALQQGLQPDIAIMDIVLGEDVFSSPSSSFRLCPKYK